MEAYDLLAITDSEIHSLLKRTEQVIKGLCKRMADEAELGSFTVLDEDARSLFLHLGMRSAYTTALYIIGGMDALLDDKTTQGGSR